MRHMAERFRQHFGEDFAKEFDCPFMKPCGKDSEENAHGQPQNESHNKTQESTAPVFDKEKISGLKSEIHSLKQEAKKCRRELKEKKQQQKQKQKDLKKAKKEFKKCEKAKKKESKAKFASEVVAHLDLEEESIQKPGTYVLKTWKVKNTGGFSWSEDTFATFKKGDKAIVTPDSLNVIVGSVAPGEVTYIRAMFVVPEEAGKYNVTFRLTSPEAGKFGAPMKNTIIVEEVEAAPQVEEEPEPTAPVKEEKEE